MKNNYVIVRDKFYIAKEEIKALERLLKEAKERERELFKEKICNHGGTGYWS